MLRALLLTAFLAAPPTAAADVPPAAAPSAPVAPAPAQAAPSAPAATAPSPAPQAAPVASPPAAQPSPQNDPALYGSPPAGNGPDTDLAGVLLKMLVMLGVVVAVIYLTLNVGLRRMLKLGPQPSSIVKVVDRVALDPKRALVVLQAAGEYLLVASSEQGISFLSKLDPEGVGKVLAERVAAPPQPSFLERLNALAKPAPRKPQ